MSVIKAYFLGLLIILCFFCFSIAWVLCLGFTIKEYGHNSWQLIVFLLTSLTVFVYALEAIILYE